MPVKQPERKPISGFKAGDCHICQQCNVKVRRLSCGRHNFCRMCSEFETKLSNGDYTCKECVERRRRRKHAAARHEIVNNFLSSPDNTFPTVPADDATESSNIDALVEEDLSENDLDGNNEEWDHLLQSMSNTSSATVSSTSDKENEHCSNQCLAIPKKASYMRLSLPPPLGGNSRRVSHVAQEISNTVTQMLDGRTGRSDEHPTSPPVSTTPSRQCERSNLKDQCGDTERLGDTSRRQSRFGVAFAPDPGELERNSSPCKGLRPRPRNSRSWYNDTCDDDSPGPESRTEEQDALADLSADLGDIEGPGFYSSSSSFTGSWNSAFPSNGAPTTDRSQPDAFWDT